MQKWKNNNNNLLFLNHDENVSYVWWIPSWWSTVYLLVGFHPQQKFVVYRLNVSNNNNVNVSVKLFKIFSKYKNLEIEKKMCPLKTIPIMIGSLQNILNKYVSIDFPVICKSLSKMHEITLMESQENSMNGTFPKYLLDLIWKSFFKFSNF